MDTLRFHALNSTIEIAIYTTLNGIVPINDANCIETERSRQKLVGG